MTIKSTVSFTDRHHKFATRKAGEGEKATVSSVVAAGIEALIQDEAEREAVLNAMSDAIRSRLSTPREEWIEDTDGMFAAARDRLASN